MAHVVLDNFRHDFLTYLTRGLTGRYYHLQGIIDRNIGTYDFFLGHDFEKPGGGIGRSRNKDAEQVFAVLAGKLIGNKADRMHAFTRKLNEDDFHIPVLTGRDKAAKYLLDTIIKRPYDRDTLEYRFAPPYGHFSEEIAGQYAGHVDYNHQGS